VLFQSQFFSLSYSFKICDFPVSVNLFVDIYCSQRAMHKFYKTVRALHIEVKYLLIN